MAVSTRTDLSVLRSLDTRRKPGVLRPGHNRMATTEWPQHWGNHRKSKPRTTKYYIGMNYHKWPKKSSSLWSSWFPTGRNVPAPSQERCLNHHGAPTEPNMQVGRASKNLSPHRIIISELWKKLMSEPGRLTRTKVHRFRNLWAQWTTQTADWNRLPLLLGYSGQLWRKIATEAISLLAQSKPVHGGLPPSLTSNYVLTLRRSKRSSSGCLFSMNSWRFLNTCGQRKPVISGTQTRQCGVAVIWKEATFPESHFNCFQASVDAGCSLPACKDSSLNTRLVWKVAPQ